MEHEFDGRWVRIEKTTFERLVAAADNHHARRARFADAAFPEQVISDWLDDLEQARTMPTPHAEAGDLLVKLGRAEFWTFTVHGWRELAPIELVEQNVAGHPDFLVGPNADVRAGWDEMTSEQVQTDEPHTVAYKLRFRPAGSRFFGRSVVEDELERLRSSASEQANRGEAVLRGMAAACSVAYGWPTVGWPAAIAEALDELLKLENAFDTVSGAAERCDIGVDERLTAFRDGIDHARVTLLTIATRHAAQGAE